MGKKLNPSYWTNGLFIGLNNSVHCFKNQIKPANSTGWIENWT